ncbi:MAG: sporulation protein YqfD [Lachnospiraceae bacterium]|nr:sporulation protein YqfD [Lachnospiraceae bacterium]
MHSFLFYIQGYVRISVQGFGATRFINICNKRGFRLRDLEQKEDEYELNILIWDYKKIQDIVRKTKVKVVIVKKCGLPFFFVKMSCQKFFVLGAILCFAGLLYMSRFIWAIKIDGNVSLTDEVILDYLETKEISMGSKLNDVDAESLEKSFRKDFDGITWISIGQEGTTLTIDIKERDVRVYEIADDSATSLYAPCDGVITSIVVRSGLAKVKTGDVVTKGQLIVDGVLPVAKTDGTILDYNLVHSDADVLVCYSETYEDSVSFYQDKKTYTQDSFTEYSFRLGNKIYQMYWFYPEFEMEEVSESFYQLQLWEHFYLPVWFGNKEHKEYEISKVKKEQKELEGQLYENLDLFLKSLEEKGVQNIQKDVKISTSGSMLILSGELMFTNSRMLEEEIDPSIRMEFINGQHDSVDNGDER